MAYRNDKLRDLTPLVTTFVPGESPTAEKLQGMIRQADAAIEYLENKVGDLAGEEESFNTWIATLARNIGDFSKLNPSVLPNHEEVNYEQNLVSGKMEHELDLVPVGELSNLIESSGDSSIVPTQWKPSVSLLQEIGDWTIESSYIENGRNKRGRKLVTYSPSNGGSVIFKKVTSGRGSSLEISSENTIPSLAQAEDGGPFPQFELIDSSTKQYSVTLPLRTKMYDKLGEIIPFTASNTKSGVGLETQHELPAFFFDTDGLDLFSDDENGNPKEIPLNLIVLYDWNTKKEVEGVISLKASPTASARKYQFVLQTKSDVILDIATGKYVFAVAGNSITNQIKAISDAVFSNTGDGTEMMRLLLHKNMLNLRTGSSTPGNRATYYGPSSIDNNDHSMYFHRNGFTDSDIGGGGNVIRGSVVIGSTTTGPDSEHPNFNVTTDSHPLYFGNIEKGPSLKYVKAMLHQIDHTYGGINNGTTGVMDSGLLITGATSDTNNLRKNIFIDGDIRTSGNVILGHSASDVIFMQGKVYVNDELTLIPRSTTGITGEEGKMLYSSTEKSVVFHNGNSWISPWKLSGYATTIGDGVTSFGKHNGQSYSVFTSALADVASGGVIKVLPGVYNILGNKISVPANVTIEGSGDSTVISGTGTLFENAGSNIEIKDLKIQGSSASAIGIRNNNDNLKIQNITFELCATGVEVTTSGTNFKIFSGVTYPDTSLPVFYSSTTLNPSYRSVVKSALNYSGTTVEDWTLKSDLLKEYYTTSVTTQVTYDPALESAIGVGAFKITGDGTIFCRKLLPVNVNVGIGGNINIKRIGTTGTASVGVICYDKDGANIGSKPFIISNKTLSNASMDSTVVDSECFFKNTMIGTEGYQGLMFPANTRFVQPYITVGSNNGGVCFDSFEIVNMTYARVGTWS